MRDTGGMHPALFYTPGERLSLPELCAARLDGHLVELGEGFTPADTVEDAASRAHSVAALIPPGTAPFGPSAAWIHGAGDRPPALHHLQRASSRRMRIAAVPRIVFHDIVVGAQDRVLIGPLIVPDAAHTLYDLARLSSGHSDFAYWARALALVRPDIVDAARSRLSGTGIRPGVRHGGRLLDECAAMTR